MKIIIFKSQKLNNDNKINDLSVYLKNKNIPFEIISEKDLDKKIYGNLLFVFGGDGTILRLVEFAINNNLPIIGVNTGNLGFLTEFEKDDYISAIDMFINGQYKEDIRSVLSLNFGKITKYALNDIVLQRKYLDDYTSLVCNISAYIDGNFIDNIKGDGVIVCTPTGSTAYSLSSGGSILAPGINANSLTPICAHSLHNRPIVFSSCSTCDLKLTGGSISSLYIDGKYLSTLKIGEDVKIHPCDKKIIFLRKKDSNFYKILITKFSKGNNDGEEK